MSSPRVLPTSLPGQRANGPTARIDKLSFAPIAEEKRLSPTENSPDIRSRKPLLILSRATTKTDRSIAEEPSGSSANARARDYVHARLLPISRNFPLAYYYKGVRGEGGAERPPPQETGPRSPAPPVGSSQPGTPNAERKAGKSLRIASAEWPHHHPTPRASGPFRPAPPLRIPPRQIPAPAHQKKQLLLLPVPGLRAQRQAADRRRTATQPREGRPAPRQTTRGAVRSLAVEPRHPWIHGDNFLTKLEIFKEGEKCRPRHRCNIDHVAIAVQPR